MITSSLFGGLGNQMFIYAMVKAMALRNNTNFAFNQKYGFEKDDLYKRKLALLDFNLKLPSSSVQVYDYPGGRYIRKISRGLGFNLLNPKCTFIKESRPFRFHEELLYLRNKNVYLEGYWQSEKYFKDFTDIIKKDFQIKKNFSSDVYEELDQIRELGDRAVMLGVRRYQESLSAPGGVLNEAYYNKAMEIIASKITSPVFFVFSQDKVWVQKHLSSKYELIYIHTKEGDDRAIDDLFLMENFKYYIISNSSFYWWGAWLSNSDTKLVIAPDNFINPDSVCSNWLII